MVGMNWVLITSCILFTKLKEDANIIVYNFNADFILIVVTITINFMYVYYNFMINNILNMQTLHFNLIFYF